MKDKKIKKAEFSNKKRILTVTYSSGKKVTIHYTHLGIKQLINQIWVDKETHDQSVGIKFADGTTDYMAYDQPLAIIGDPDFLLQNHIEVLIAQIKKTIKGKNISKRYLSSQLGTSDNQVHRLLNPKIVNKNLPQLYHLAALLGLEIQLKAA